MKDLNLKPVTNEYLNYFIENVLAPLLRSENLIANAIPKAGSYSLLQYILRCSNLIETSLSKKVNQRKWFFIDLSSSSTITSQLTAGFNIKSEYNFPQLLTKFTQLISTKKRIVIVVNSTELIDDSLKEYLKTIQQLNSSLITFLFMINGESTEKQLNDLQLDFNIYSALTLKLKSEADMDVLLSKEEIWFDYQIPAEIKAKIIKLSGGYSYLARTLLAYANKNKDTFLNANPNSLILNRNIQLPCEKVWNSLSTTSQQTLISFILGTDLENTKNNFLQLANIYNGSNLFSLLFAEYIHLYLLNNVEITKENNYLYRSGVEISGILSTQEELLFTLLFENKNKVITRDQIAYTIWGKDWCDKYSDSMLDKLISTLRKKLILNKDTLQALKSKGFILKLR